jgi:AraC-like DNA-binding protein
MNGLAPTGVSFHDLSRRTDSAMWEGFLLGAGTVFFWLARGRGRLRAGAEGTGHPVVLAGEACLLREAAGWSFAPDLSAAETAFGMVVLGPGRDLVPAADLEALAGRGLFAVAAARQRERLRECSLHRPDGGGLALELELASLLVLLAREPAQAPDARSPAARRHAEAAMAWMEARLDGPLRLGELAAALAVSPDSLHRAFRQVLGVPPLRWFARQRYRQACLLLADPRFSIKEISWRLGFARPADFARGFWLETGLSPRDYRRGLATVSRSTNSG